MKENCIICLQECKNKFCNRCTTYCHVGCLTSYIAKCCLTRCPVCKSEDTMIPPSIKIHKKTIVSTIKNYISTIHAEINKDKKLLINDNFFNYVAVNIDRINTFKSLKDFVNKIKVILMHLHTEEEWEPSLAHYNQIFDQPTQNL